MKEINTQRRWSSEYLKSKRLLELLGLEGDMERKDNRD